MNKVTLLKKITLIVCLASMFIMKNNVTAYVIRGVHECFANCENKYLDCAQFCDMKESARRCEKRCDRVFFLCAADCPPY